MVKSCSIQGRHSTIYTNYSTVHSSDDCHGIEIKFVEGQYNISNNYLTKTLKQDRLWVKTGYKTGVQ